MWFFNGKEPRERWVAQSKTLTRRVTLPERRETLRRDQAQATPSRAKSLHSQMELGAGGPLSAVDTHPGGPVKTFTDAHGNPLFRVGGATPRPSPNPSSPPRNAFAGGFGKATKQTDVLSTTGPREEQTERVFYKNLTKAPPAFSDWLSGGAKKFWKSSTTGSAGFATVIGLLILIVLLRLIIVTEPLGGSPNGPTLSRWSLFAGVLGGQYTLNDTLTPPSQGVSLPVIPPQGRLGHFPTR